ncbi:MAG: DUF58 domain-containing protein [Acidobacteriota bacterium]|nr:DUF58 domain-containing protein [Acidobacteriota bacterium]
MGKRRVPEGIRPTKVGIWFVGLCLLIGVAATNTGNNALYMVLALMLATLIVSGVLSRNNVRRVDVEVDLPEEIFAGSEAGFQLQLNNDSRFLPRWLLLISFSGQSQTLLCSHLPHGATRTMLAAMTFPCRGRQRLTTVHLATLFPLGLFRKGMRQSVDIEILVYPRIRPGGYTRRSSFVAFGATPDRSIGWGHELHSLRPMRPGDDLRRVHWKQTARTGKMIFIERQAEQQRRVSVVVDNALDPSDGLEAEEELESRISLGASAALDYINAGFEVELVTRTACLPHDGGARLRRRVLETLALLETVPPTGAPLVGDAEAALEVRFDGASVEALG